MKTVRASDVKDNVNGDEKEEGEIKRIDGNAIGRLNDVCMCEAMVMVLVIETINWKIEGARERMEEVRAK